MLARQLRTDPLRQIRMAVTLVTAILVIGPLSLVLVTSVSKGLPLVDGLTFTLEHFVSLLDVKVLNLVVNTLVFAAGSLLLGLLLGATLAFLTERTDLPFRDGVYFALFTAMIFPVMVQSMGWILFLSPRIGLANLWLRPLLGVSEESGPLNIYSVEGMIFVTGLSVVGTTYVMLTAVMRMNADLEEAARTSGDTFLGAFRAVTLPLLAPGLFSVAVYMMMVLVQVFDTPLILGIPANFPVLSLRIYLAAHPDWGLPVYGLSAAYGVVLLSLGFLLLLGYFQLTRLKERFQVLGGKGFRSVRLKLGAWRYVALALVGVVLVLKLVPSLLLIWASLLLYYQPPSLEMLSEVSLRNYRVLLENPQLAAALGNTVILGLAVPTLTIILVCLIGWLLARSHGSRLLDLVSFAPVAIPSTLIALALLVLLVRSPIYDTIWILVLALVAHFVGYGTRVMHPAFLQLHRDLEDAAGASGAGPLTALRTVSVPLLLGPIINSWLWLCIHSIRDLQVPLMLFSSSNIVLSVLIFREWSAPNTSVAAAAAMMLVGLVALMFTALAVVRRRVAGDI